MIWMTAADEAFILAARNALPKLLARIEALEKERDAYKKFVDIINKDNARRIEEEYGNIYIRPPRGEQLEP
jgi:hypothetical protein